MPLTNDDVNKVLKLIASKQISLDVCSIFKDASSMTFLENKESASESYVFFADLLATQSSRVALKIWMNWDEIPEIDSEALDKIEAEGGDEGVREVLEKHQNPLSYASLTYEKNVYEFVTESILKPGFCNNFIPLVAFSSCDVSQIFQDISVSSLPQSQKELLMNKFRPLTYIPGLKMNIMITGSKDLKSFQQLLKTNLDTLPLEEVANIIFQLLYAIWVMQHYKMNQGDLHLGNILLEILETEKVVPVGPELYIRTKYIPKIYDFDHSFVQALGPNPFYKNNSYLAGLHAVNQFRLNQDYYQLICGLKSLKSAKVNQVLDPILPMPKFNSWYQKLRQETNWRGEIIDQYADNRNVLVGKVVVNQLLAYLKSYPEQGTLIQGVQFIAVDTGFFLKLIPLDILLIDYDQKQRIIFSKNVWIAIQDEKTIKFLGGWQCHPVEDPSNQILHPLESLFTQDALFVLLATHVTLTEPQPSEKSSSPKAKPSSKSSRKSSTSFKSFRNSSQKQGTFL